jgi:hypothetical protein
MAFTLEQSSENYQDVGMSVRHGGCDDDKNKRSNGHNKTKLSKPHWSLMYFLQSFYQVK